ncbi:Alpha/Beta hydrolase protein [Lanmaoa asiatica]|nr:Alpha/Beta hydrolase protein [Lanmaoa asiatica]
MAERNLQYYHHGRFKVAGGVLPDAVTAYQAFGDPSNPCVVYPAYYGAKLSLGALDALVGEDKVLDPRKYYVVTFALFCNGEPPPYNGPYFPEISYEDNMYERRQLVHIIVYSFETNSRAQYAVLTKVLGVKKVYCALGFSMGGQQAYHWATVYPDFVEKIAVVVSAARTSMHNRCILEGPKAALIASKDFKDGHYTSPPHHGIRAFGRVILPWVYSQAWFREHNYLMGGQYPDLSSFIRGEGESNWVQNWDANDMLHLLNTWQNGDISQVRDNGDYEKALRSIKAEVLLLPSKTDLFFAPEYSEIELSFLQRGTLVQIDTNWGHSSQSQSDIKYYHHGRFSVAGGILPDAVTAYQTYGNPQNPCIVFPTCYGAKLALGSKSNECCKSSVLDTKKYYVVTFAVFCNGEVCKMISTHLSSNCPAPYNGPYFPFVSYGDNIRAQHAVFPWVANKRITGPWCSPTSWRDLWRFAPPHEQAPIINASSKARRAAMLASKDFADGHYTSTPHHGIRAFGRVYCAWAYGQTWFREHQYLMGGEYPDLNSFVRERWEGRYLQYWDANDMVALLTTWQKGDISIIHDGGDYEKALKSIKAKGLIMPSKTDLYFPPEDSQIEVSYLRDATLHVIPTVWGHVAGGGANPVDVKFISDKIHAFLNH